MRRVSQYVGEKIRWGRNWADDLASGVTISTSSWSSNPTTSIVLSGDGIAQSQTSVLVETQAAGFYLLTNQVNLSSGERLYEYFALTVKDPEDLTSSLFATPEELFAELPADGEPLTLEDAEVERERWIAQLKYSPLTPRERALAADVVEDGARASLEAQQLRLSGRVVPQEIYDRINAARDLRREYDALRGGRRF